MLALLWLEDHTCRDCGIPLFDTLDEQAWLRADHFTCRGCQTLAAERKQVEQIAKMLPDPSLMLDGVHYHARALSGSEQRAEAQPSTPIDESGQEVTR